MINIENLSPEELQALIKKAQSALEDKQATVRKQGIAQIKQIAAEIGVTVEIIDNQKASKSSSSVEPKYVHPDKPNLVWSGRGLTPKWLSTLIENGHNKDEYLIKK